MSQASHIVVMGLQITSTQKDMQEVKFFVIEKSLF